MPRVRRSMRSFPHCSRAHPTLLCSSVLPACVAMRARSDWRTPRLRTPPAAARSSGSSANISISSSVSGAAGRGELLPYGSYYLTGFLHERPLARLRADLSKLGIERAAGQAEPEDHAAILCEIMAGLVSRRFSAPAGGDRELFEQHLAPWIGRFFADLERAEAADFYRRIGMLGRVFIEIETDAFALPS